MDVVDAPREGRGGSEQLGPHGKAAAVVATLGDPVPDSVEIRIVDPLTDKLVVRRMYFQPSSDVTAKTLAIRTLDLIRATFLELDLAPAPREPAPGQVPPPPLPAVAAQAPARLPERVRVEVGATAIFDLDASMPTLVPIVRMSWALRPWLLPQLTAAGLGTRRTLGSNGASADLSQQFALLGASYRFRAALRLRPFLSLAGGGLHTSAQGQAANGDDPPRNGRSCSTALPARGWPWASACKSRWPCKHKWPNSTRRFVLPTPWSSRRPARACS